MMNIHEIYSSRLTTAEEAASRVQSGWRLASDAFTASTDGFYNALCRRAKESDELRDVVAATFLDAYAYDFFKDSSLNGKINCESFFSSAGARNAVNGGFGDVFPGYYRDFPRLIRQFRHYDVFCIAVSPMDEHGYFSASTMCSCTEAFLEKSDRIFVEVNEKLPRTLCNTQIHVSQVDAIIENKHDLPVMAAPKLDDVSLAIGNLIAEQIPDGSCIQLGIGAIPDATGLALKSKHDLGIHTELFTDSMVELIECGAVNNSKKQIHRGKTVTTLAFGSQRIYDYINNNPDIMLLPVDYVNNPDTICKNDQMISINAAIEVDFWGQVCSESVGTRHMSGTGGQVDYVRGACQSKGGKSFIAFASTAKNGTVSKIRPTLASGAIVTTSKNDVDFIVTEYGIAQMRGCSLKERTKQLISIAHPDFRDELAFEARKMNIL